MRRNMKVVLAFDSFKGCMSAREACKTAGDALRILNTDYEVVDIPLSDGGEGLVDAIQNARGGMKDGELERITMKAHGPLMEEIEARYVIDKQSKTAYMEMAETSGLTLVPKDRRNPELTTTYGVGEMIVDAKKMGVKHIVMGIGGSATCDGGKGMLDAINESGTAMESLPKITVACDVTNPLFGTNGAAYVFGPQKGASPEQVEILDKRLRDFAKETEEKGIAKPELANYPGTGAAGGLGYALLAYMKAKLKSGIDIILDITKFDEQIEDADIIITGEGKSDEQTMMGKVPQGVLKRVRAYNNKKKHPKQVLLISGGIEDTDNVLSRNFDVVKSINEGDDRTIDVLMQSEVAKENLARTISSLKNQFLSLTGFDSL